MTAVPVGWIVQC